MTKSRGLPTATLRMAEQMASEANSKFDMAELSVALWDVFDGASGIAKEFKFQYDAMDEPGRPAKLNAMTALLSTLVKTQELLVKQGGGREEAPVDPKAMAPLMAEFMRDHMTDFRAVVEEVYGIKLPEPNDPQQPIAGEAGGDAGANQRPPSTVGPGDHPEVAGG